MRKVRNVGARTRLPRISWPIPISSSTTNSSLSHTEVMLALVGRKVLDGVAEHGGRHRVGVRIQEVDKPAALTLADLAQHPANSLLDQVVYVVQQDFGDSERVIKLFVADKLPRADDGNPPLPKVIGL